MEHSALGTRKPAPIDGFEPKGSVGSTDPAFANDQFELTFHRQPTIGNQPPIGLTARWKEHPDSIVLTTVEPLKGTP